MPQNSNVAIAVGPTTARQPLKTDNNSRVRVLAGGKPPINTKK